MRSVVTHSLLDLVFPIVGVLFHHLVLQLIKRIPSDRPLNTRRVRLNLLLSYVIGSTELLLDVESVSHITVLVWSPFLVATGAFAFKIILHIFKFPMLHLVFLPFTLPAHYLAESASHLLYHSIEQDLDVFEFSQKVHFISTMLTYICVQDIYVAVLLDFEWFDHNIWSFLYTFEALIASVLNCYYFRACVYKKITFSVDKENAEAGSLLLSPPSKKAPFRPTSASPKDLHTVPITGRKKMSARGTARPPTSGTAGNLPC